MDPNIIEAAVRSSLFSGLDSEGLQHVLNCLNYRVVNYEKNDYVVRIDEEIDGVCIMVEGEAAVVRESSNGSRVIVNIFHVGQMFGETVVFSGDTKWPSTAQALTACTVMFLYPEKILTMCERACAYHKIILGNLVRVVSEKATILNRKVDYLSLKSINGKLSKYLLEQYKASGTAIFTLPLNREALADFLNVSRPSMSRELGRMRDNGIIDFYKESIRILDVAKLEALLE
ncbi:cAMP-binding domain of CRP or a regulatory subunit of cAMP-dependent protein kinases [Sporobacter termitidis DSM 10068]|uniref:cAMP-binding domain of CRP or a regulatory subunit of cAMP-dependent protein kinases n=1 Tax=Sporobacter termitidis DSM 10068 TaxID=1123282 RepID=A0A1M5Z028_9FIRM|nr:Crp/Fnr family transcriptional regulator [Sporobacter termitidis]SHI17605.1 cAMP-binding domain of CRP or a regulatory subunit of cAMP-dependent protein kinases [Sporobacter termitidis DSM 10068]